MPSPTEGLKLRWVHEDDETPCCCVSPSIWEAFPHECRNCMKLLPTEPMPTPKEHVAPAFQNDTTISFITEIDFRSEEFSLLVRQHPANKDFVEFVLNEDGKEDPLFCFPNKYLATLIHALQMHQGNLNIAE